LEALRAKALHWLERAGDLAVGRYEIDEGLMLFHRALELGPHEDKASELWRKVGRANVLKFDGEAFWTSMQNALEACRDSATRGDIYSWLAFETAGRSGMWTRSPDLELVQGWIDQALELSAPGSAAHARALIARCFWAWRWIEPMPPGVADEASRIAERLGDPDLRSFVWSARAGLAFGNNRYGEALDWTRRRFDLLDQITDPDHMTNIYEEMAPLCVACGDFTEASRMAETYEELARNLSAHHRLHGVAIALELEEARGDWARIHDLIPRTQEAVAENMSTPCVRNMRSLLLGALASMYVGEVDSGRRLEEEAERLAMEGHDDALRAPRLRLALVRGDLGRVEELVVPSSGFRKGMFFFIATYAAHFDALVALGKRERVEEEAPRDVIPGTYLEPFALRALGQVREDEVLIGQALERFEAMKLDWHAEETRKLLA